MKKIKNIKSIKAVIVCVMLSALMLVGCGSEKEEAGKYTSKEIYDKVMTSITDMENMKVVDNTTEEGKDAFSYVTEMGLDKIKDFVFAYSADGNADEIIVMQVKSSDDVSQAKKDLEERLETRKSTFSVYNAEEGAKFNGATVVTNGNYLMLIIGNQAQNGKYQFNKMFE